MDRLLCKLGLHLVAMINMSEDGRYLRFGCLRLKCDGIWVYDAEREVVKFSFNWRRT